MSDEIEDQLVSKTAELIETGRNQEALQTAESLEKYKNEDAIVLYTKGIALYKNKMFEDALRYFSEAANLNREEKRLWYAIGYTLIALNRVTEARDALRYVLGVDENHLGAHIGMFAVCIFSEEEEEAFYHLQKATEINKTNTKKLLRSMYEEFIEPSNVGEETKISIKKRIDDI